MTNTTNSFTERRDRSIDGMTMPPSPATGRLSPEQVEDEVGIVWLRPVGSLPRYVRERLDTCAPSRSRRWRFGNTGVVGYAVLGPDARSSSGHFARRVFWLAKHDPGERDYVGGAYQGGGCPCEAVDPLTVRPGQPGLCTDRCGDPAADVKPTNPTPTN